MKYQFFILLSFFCFSTYFVDGFNFDRSLSSQTISKETLKKEIIARMERVDELRAMKELAQELGIKQVYLFGGSAAAWAHYVYWDLEREAGMGHYDESRFDYDYTSIFRANQDMDIVIDVNEENEHLVKEFEQILQERFKHFQGNKPVWEVRPLRFDYRGKERILDNSDFLNQNSDSHSTGLISVTDNDEYGIRDFKDWEELDNHFFNDVFKRKLHLYRDSKKHKGTQRFKKGMNPEIFSVIRYLTKAFQYELEMDKKSLAAVRRILKEFNSKKDLRVPYTKSWMEKNAKKLYQNAIDLEFAYRTMQKLKLQELLISIGKNKGKKNSLAWWMNKQPLLTSNLGNRSKGKTAAELGIDTVAHETNNFAAYESITKSHSGLANVFISRKGVSGEMAAYGDGFYARRGYEGARGSGLTIRFKVNPHAVKGIDFEIKNNDYVIIKNKAILEVISESLDISLVDYFKKVINGDLIFDYSDRGVEEKVKRKIGLKLNSEVDEKVKKELYGLVKNYILESDTVELNSILKDWFATSTSTEFPDLVDILIEKSTNPEEIIRVVLSQPHWKVHRHFMQRFIDKREHFKAIATFVLSQPTWKNEMEWLKVLMDSGEVDMELITNVLGQDHWVTKTKLIENFTSKITDTKLRAKIFEYVFSHESWGHRIDIFSGVIEGRESSDVLLSMINHVFSKSHMTKYPELVERLIAENTDRRFVASSILSKPHWSIYPHLVQKMIDLGNHEAVITYILPTSTHRELSQWVEFYLEEEKYDRMLIQHLFRRHTFQTKKEWLEKIIERKINNNILLRDVLFREKWQSYPDLFETLIEDEKNDEVILMELLGQKHWKHKPEWLELIIKRDNCLDENLNYVLKKGHWKYHPYFEKKLKGKLFTLANIRAYLKEENRCVDTIGELL